METVLVREYRADIMECAHSGHICIVNEEGKVKACAGDPQYVTFTRSSAKPLQAIPAIRAGLADHYHLTDQEIAIMTASHRGERVHQETVLSLVKKLGIDKSKLVCASSYPLDVEARDSMIRIGRDKSKLHHNCSGKHLGLLAYCQMQGLSLEGYEEPDHPVQQEVLSTVAYMSGLSTDEITLGTDGCGLPVFALPIQALATAYMKLACPDRIKNEETRRAVETITKAMNTHPYMVAGSGRVDTLLLQDENIIAKGGFKGVYCFGLKKERLGIAFKVLDGSEEEWGYIAESILEQIGYGNKDTIDRLREAYTKELYNDGGQKVGRAETTFTLKYV